MRWFFFLVMVVYERLKTYVQYWMVNGEMWCLRYFHHKNIMINLYTCDFKTYCIPKWTKEVAHYCVLFAKCSEQAATVPTIALVIKMYKLVNLYATYLLVQHCPSNRITAMLPHCWLTTEQCCMAFQNRAYVNRIFIQTYIIVKILPATLNVLSRW